MGEFEDILSPTVEQRPKTTQKKSGRKQKGARKKPRKAKEEEEEEEEAELDFVSLGDSFDPEEDELKPASGRNETLPPLLADGKGSAQFLDEYNALDELLNEGTREYSIDLRTEVTDIQIVQFSRARVMAAHFKVPILSEFVTHLERLSVSKNRKGRKEFVDAFKAVNSGSMEGGLGNSMMERLRS